MASISHLPPEILDRIVFFLPSLKDYDFDSRTQTSGPPLARLATIDRRWREAVEHVLFHHLRVSSFDVDDFATCFSRQRRRRRHILHELHYIVLDCRADEEYLLPDPRDPASMGLFQASMTAALKRLFKELGNWRRMDLDDAVPVPIYLDKLRVTFDGTPWYGDHIDKWASKEIHELAQPYLKLLSSPRLTLLDTPPEDFSETYGLDAICPSKELYIDSDLCKLAPGSIITLARCVPAVDRLEIHIHGGQRNDPPYSEIIRAVRDDLAANVNLLPPSLRSVEVVLDTMSPSEHTQSVPDYRSGTGPPTDKLSESLRIFSQRLENFKISISHLSPELFWPQFSELDNNIEVNPFWASLRDLQINTTIMTPAGGWSLQEPDLRFTARDWSHPAYWRRGQLYRQRPIRAFFDTFAISVASAMIQMPQLRRLWYRASGAFLEHNGWEFVYRCGGLYENNASLGKTANGMPKVEWIIYSPKEQVQWKPPPEARRLWWEKCGGNLEEDLITLDVTDQELSSTGFTRTRDGAQVPFLEAPWDKNTEAISF